MILPTYLSTYLSVFVEVYTMSPDGLKTYFGILDKKQDLLETTTAVHLIITSAGGSVSSVLHLHSTQPARPYYLLVCEFFSFIRSLSDINVNKKHV